VSEGVRARSRIARVFASAKAQVKERPALAIGLVVSVAFGAAVGFLPLFGGVGYEHDIATGLFCPSVAAVSIARHLSSRPPRTPLSQVVAGLSYGVVLACVSLGLALVHGLRVRSCDPLGGLSVYALTAGFGTVLGGAWGAVVAEVARKTKRPRLVATLLGIGLPLASALVSLGRFFSSPMIFAYDPFVGFFSGTLYDTVVDAGPPLVSYRLASLCTVTSLLVASSLLVRAPSGALRFGGRESSFFRERLFLAVVTGLASVWVAANGSAYGHSQTRESIMAALGGRLEGARCDVVFPSSLSPDEAKLLRKDCEDDLAMVERRLGAKGPAKITAFFFRDAGEKRRLMGAEHTYIAKPWREEVYLQMDHYPHPVLGHELAHVVAGSFGAGPFRIAGSFGGLVPNPGLIEGIAVAASPDDDDVTDLAWAKTMMDLGILPPMRKIFSLGFLGEASAKSYTLAGAFVTWALETYGADKVRAWYHGAPLEELVGVPWEAIEAKFREALGKVVVAKEAAAVAKARFDRPSVFGRRCPHVVDALRRKADGCRDARQVDEAIAGYLAVLKEDPRDPSAKVSLAYVERRYRDRQKGRASLEAVESDRDMPKPSRDRASEALADTDFTDGAFAEAEVRYTRLAASVLDEDQARTFEVKALAARRDDLRGPVGLFLMGERERSPDPFVGGVALGRALASHPDDALLLYLVGRNAIQRGHVESGIEHLEKALATGTLPTERLTREALRQLAQGACATGNVGLVERVRTSVVAPRSPFHEGGRKDMVVALLDRCKP
jgi:tetratricopeptide (TPR) repeat protein